MTQQAAARTVGGQRYAAHVVAAYAADAVVRGEPVGTGPDEPAVGAMRDLLKQFRNSFNPRIAVTVDGVFRGAGSPGCGTLI